MYYNERYVVSTWLINGMAMVCICSSTGNELEIGGRGKVQGTPIHPSYYLCRIRILKYVLLCHISYFMVYEREGV